MKKDSSRQIYAVLDGDYGLLSLNSNPLGANVFLNDSLIGKTPLIEHEIKSGNYYMKIIKENYLPAENFIEITPRLKEMNVDLISSSGSFTFNNVAEDQKVYIDGLLLDKNKLKDYILPIGNHQVHLLDTKLNKEIFDNINVAPGNHYDVSFNYGKFSFKPLIYSAVIPGLGQMYSKFYMKGTCILISTIASGCLTAWAINNYHQKTNDYNSFQNKYYSAATEADASYYHSMMQDAYDKTNTASTLKNIAIGTLVGIYLYNLLDAVLFSGNLDVMNYYQQKSQYQLKKEIGADRIKVGVQWNF